MHRPSEFMKNIMPHYSNQTRYKSFQRQLNFYGFSRIRKGVHKGICCHVLFRRDRPELCRDIARLKSGCLNGRENDRGEQRGEQGAHREHNGIHHGALIGTLTLPGKSQITEVSSINQKEATYCDDHLKNSEQSMDESQGTSNAFRPREERTTVKIRLVPSIGINHLMENLDDDLIKEVIKTFGAHRIHQSHRRECNKHRESCSCQMTKNILATVNPSVFHSVVLTRPGNM